MLKKKSDYAANRRNPDCIVYQTANGPILLTRHDFDNEAEFLHWKEWSDQNYREEEQQNRSSDEHLELNEYIEATAVLLDFINEAREKGISEQALKIQSFQMAYQYGKRTLTKTQRRRLMLYAHGMTIPKIALAEGVKKQSVHESLSSAKRKLIKFVKKLSIIHENTLTPP